MAEWLGLNRTTVMRWMLEENGNAVPSRRWAQLIAAAKTHGFDITVEELVPPLAEHMARLPVSRRVKRQQAA